MPGKLTLSFLVTFLGSCDYFKFTISQYCLLPHGSESWSDCQALQFLFQLLAIIMIHFFGCLALKVWFSRTASLHIWLRLCNECMILHLWYNSGFCEVWHIKIHLSEKLLEKEWVATFTDLSEFCGQWQVDEQRTFMMASKPVKASLRSFLCFLLVSDPWLKWCPVDANSVYFYLTKWFERTETLTVLWICSLLLFTSPLFQKPIQRVAISLSFEDLLEDYLLWVCDVYKL